MFAIFHDEKLGKQGKIKKEWMGDEEVKILWKSLWTEERGQELEKAWEGLNANWKKASREGENERYKVSPSNFWLSEKLKRPPRNAITNPLSLAHASSLFPSVVSSNLSGDTYWIKRALLQFFTLLSMHLLKRACYYAGLLTTPNYCHLFVHC